MRKRLLILFCFIISYFSFSENIVITSIQPLYSLTTYITKDTDINVYNAFGSETSMTMSREAINEENFDLSI
ncbi:MAG: copper-binding protein, partial [Fusobacterium sp.]|nr:copper-binding protein [Fusobacterium sp.]